VFENHQAVKGLAGSDLLLPPIRGYYERVIDYGLDTAWGKLLHPDGRSS